MSHEPKKRHSKERQGKRRSAIKLTIVKGVQCKNCKSFKSPHTVCSVCGFYNGRQVLDMKKTSRTTAQTP